jgi:hypothetical protein
VPFACSLSLGLLTCPSICTVQFVRAHCSLAFLRCLDLSPPLCSLGSQCPSLTPLSFALLTFPPLRGIQNASALHSLTFFCRPDLSLIPSFCALQKVSVRRSFFGSRCPDLVLPLRPPGSECLARTLSFSVLTCSCVCGLQEVSGSLAHFLSLS